MMDNGTFQADEILSEHKTSPESPSKRKYCGRCRPTSVDSRTEIAQIGSALPFRKGRATLGALDHGPKESGEIFTFLCRSETASHRLFCCIIIDMDLLRRKSTKRHIK